MHPNRQGAHDKSSDNSRIPRRKEAEAVLKLDRRFPGLGRQIDESMAAAIDGEMFHSAYLVPLNPGSEIYLIPKIAAAELRREIALRSSVGPWKASRKRTAQGGPALT